MVTAVLACSLRAAARQRTYPCKAEYDLLRGYLNGWKDTRNQADEIIHFFIGAARFIGIIDLDVGGADQDFVEQRKEQHNSPILIFKKEFISIDRGTQFRIIHDNMRTFCTAYIPRGQTEVVISKVDPRASRIDHQFWMHFISFICQLIT